MRDRFGPTALVVGGSEGLGAAWAESLASSGLDLVLVARRADVLGAFADQLRRRHGVSVDAIAGDLREPDWLEDDTPSSLASRRDIGFVVVNAASSPAGPFVSTSLDALEETVHVNCLGALSVARALLPGMVERGKGGLVLMSSLAGMQGSPGLVAYSATKSYLRVLAEGLWHEVRPAGVEVIACVAGAVATPGYATSTSSRAPGTMAPEAVVKATLAAIGRTPVVVPGKFNSVASAVMSRAMSRRVAIEIMARANKAAGLLQQG